MVNPVGGSGGDQNPVDGGDSTTNANEGLRYTSTIESISGVDLIRGNFSSISIQNFLQESGDPLIDFFQLMKDLALESLFSGLVSSAGTLVQKLPTGAEVEERYAARLALSEDINALITAYNNKVGNLFYALDLMEDAAYEMSVSNLSISNQQDSMYSAAESWENIFSISFGNQYYVNGNWTYNTFRQRLFDDYVVGLQNRRANVQFLYDAAKAEEAAYWNAFDLYNDNVAFEPDFLSDWADIQDRITEENDISGQYGNVFPDFEQLPTLDSNQPLTEFRTINETSYLPVMTSVYTPNPTELDIYQHVPNSFQYNLTSQTVYNQSFVPNMTGALYAQAARFETVHTILNNFNSDVFLVHKAEHGDLLDAFNQVTIGSASEFEDEIVGELFNNLGADLAVLRSLFEEVDDEDGFTSLLDFVRSKGINIANTSFRNIGGQTANNLGGLDRATLDKMLQKALVEDMVNADRFPELSNVMDVVKQETRRFTQTYVGVASIVGSVDAFSIANNYTLSDPERVKELFVQSTLSHLNQVAQENFEEITFAILDRLTKQYEIDQQQLEELAKLIQGTLADLFISQSLALVAIVEEQASEFELFLSNYYAKLSSDLSKASIKATLANQEIAKQNYLENKRVELNNDRKILEAFKEDLRFGGLTELANREKVNQLEEVVQKVTEDVFETYPEPQLPKETIPLIKDDIVTGLINRTPQEKDLKTQEPQDLSKPKPEPIGVAELKTLVSVSVGTRLPNVSSDAMADAFLVRFNENEVETRLDRQEKLMQNRKMGDTFKNTIEERQDTVLQGNSYENFVNHMAASVDTSKKMAVEDIVQQSMDKKEVLQEFSSSSEMKNLKNVADLVSNTVMAANDRTAFTPTEKWTAVYPV